MLYPILKKNFWKHLDEGAVPSNPVKFHLKYIQDVEAFHLVKGCSGLVIGEIGANHSRILPELSADNDCYCIDRFDVSVGQGYTKKPDNVDYKFLDCFVGNSSDVIEDDTFDVLFSVSVVEHVPTEGLKEFFDDSLRILKPGGFCIHLIDMYMSDTDLSGGEGRYKEYFDFLTAKRERAVCPEAIVPPAEMRFSTAFATNPDDTMKGWNRLVPNLTVVRERSQSCSIIMGFYKSANGDGSQSSEGKRWLSSKEFPRSISDVYD